MARKNKEGLLDFFINGRRSLVQQWQREISIPDLRKLAEERFSHRKMLPARYLGDFLNSKSCLPVPEFVFDSDFRAPLGRSEKSKMECPSAGASALFLPPEEGLFSLGGDSVPLWVDFLSQIPPEVLCLRTGFLSTEFDVLETAALGFHGLCVHARVLDLYEIQLFTEICRDFSMTLIAIADSASTVERILESDCPYVGLWGYDVETFSPQFSLLSKLVPKIPSTCHRVVFLPSTQQVPLDVLRSMSVGACFV